MNGNVERVEDVVDEARGEHEAGIDGAADNATERVPGALVEPVEEVIEAVRDHVIGGAVVEPRVELVYDTLVADHREQARHEARDVDAGERREYDERLHARRVEQAGDWWRRLGLRLGLRIGLLFRASSDSKGNVLGSSVIASLSGRRMLARSLGRFG